MPAHKVFAMKTPCGRKNFVLRRVPLPNTQSRPTLVREIKE